MVEREALDAFGYLAGDACPAARRRPIAGACDLLAEAVRGLRSRLERRRVRRDLAALPGPALKDLGLRRIDVDAVVAGHHVFGALSELRRFAATDW